MSDASNVITTSVITAISTSGLLSIALKVWIEKGVEHKFNERLATHTAKLTRDNELEITAFKHKLELAAAEQNYRFTHVFEKTVTAIAETHGKLVDLHDALNERILNCEGLDDPEYVKLTLFVNEKWDSFQEFYKQKRIFVPKSIDEKIGEFANEITRCQSLHDRMLKAEKAKVNQEAMEKMLEAFEKLMDSLLELRSELIDEFQRVLGFPIDDKGKQ